MSPYELPTRWLEWHVIPLESLKRQIETIKAEIARREGRIGPLYANPWNEETNTAELKQRAIDDMREVLATLESLLKSTPPAPAAG
jgi:hypothetical protein